MKTSACYLACLLAMVAIASGSDLPSSGCDLDNIPAMTNFQPALYAGTWYPTHDFRLSPYLFYVSRLTYTNTWVPGSGAIVSRVAMVMDGGSCREYSPAYSVNNGVLTLPSTRNGVQRRDVMTIIATDYTSTILFLYEVYEDGVRNEDMSNLSLMVRDPSQEPDIGVVTSALEGFCGPDAADLDFFEEMDFDWTATCQSRFRAPH